MPQMFPIVGPKHGCTVSPSWKKNKGLHDINSDYSITVFTFLNEMHFSFLNLNIKVQTTPWLLMCSVSDIQGLHCLLFFFRSYSLVQGPKTYGCWVSRHFNDICLGNLHMLTSCIINHHPSAMMFQGNNHKIYSLNPGKIPFHLIFVKIPYSCNCQIRSLQKFAIFHGLLPYPKSETQVHTTLYLT